MLMTMMPLRHMVRHSMTTAYTKLVSRTFNGGYVNSRIVSAGPHVDRVLAILRTLINFNLSLLIRFSAMCAARTPPRYLHKKGNPDTAPFVLVSKPLTFLKYLGT